MNFNEWDAPYTSPLRGCLKLVGTVLGTVALVVVVLLARGLIGSLFHG